MTHKEYTAHFRFRDTAGELHDRFRRYAASSLKEAKAKAKQLEGRDETRWLIDVYVSG